MVWAIHQQGTAVIAAHLSLFPAHCRSNEATFTFSMLEGEVNVAVTFRAAGPIPTPLGILAKLPGHWAGYGFNITARPDFQNGNPFFLEVNATSESFAFDDVGDIPNRGSIQNDLHMAGVRYLQAVHDDNGGGRIHVEPGLWIHVPPPAAAGGPPEAYVRLATVPHGDSVLAQSSFFTTVAGGPILNPVDSTPFTGAIPGLNASPAAPVTNPAYLAPYLTSPLPAGLPAGLVAADTIKDAVLVLKAQIAGQVITSTDVIEISTSIAPGVPGIDGILNTPFVTSNANVAQLDAIFWIETVNHPSAGGPQFFQLQYVQRVILNFPPAVGAGVISWPHISVGTLIKQA